MSRWLTHHFLSISTCDASIMKMLISYCYGERKGTARKSGLHAIPASSACSLGDPSVGKVSLQTSQGARPHTARATRSRERHACSPQPALTNTAFWFPCAFSQLQRARLQKLHACTGTQAAAQACVPAHIRARMQGARWNLQPALHDFSSSGTTTSKENVCRSPQLSPPALLSQTGEQKRRLELQTPAALQGHTQQEPSPVRDEMP